MAQMLKKSFEVIFVCKEIPIDIVSEIQRLSFSLIEINSESGFFRLLKKSDIVVLDHYSFKSKNQLCIRKIGCKLVCIDDMHDKEFFADLIINHAPNIEPINYNAQYYTQFATGLDYVLLRPVFLKLAKQSNTAYDIEKVFICFGGSDFKNLTQTVVQLIKKDKRFSHIDVVVGSSYQYIDNLKQILYDDHRFALHIGIGSEDMASLIMQAGVAIVPASGILQEVLALGCRAISGMYVDNQKNIFDNYRMLNAFENAECFSEADIKKSIDSIFETRSHTPRQLIDGHSGERILKIFNQFLLEDQVVLRYAIKNDLLKTFEWASNASIRKFFFNVSPIKFEDHKKWFNFRLSDPNCFYFIGLFNSKEFGSIRFDVSEDTAVVSYLIDPSFQSIGLGTILLKKGLELFIAETETSVKNIYGEVLKENVASVKIFKKLGYDVSFNEETGLFKFEKIIKYG